MEVNTAPMSELLRIPGIGPRTAERIVKMRSAERLRSVDALRVLGVPWRVASPFVLVDGKSPVRQLALL